MQSTSIYGKYNLKLIVNVHNAGSVVQAHP